MNRQYSDVLRDNVLSNRPLFTRLFLSQPFVTAEDIILRGFAASSEEVERLLEQFQTGGLVEKRGRTYGCAIEAIAWISQLLPPNDAAEKLQRRICTHFNPEVQRLVVQTTLQAFSPGKGTDSPVQRPPWYFDLTAIIHPALTIDFSLNITGCSEELCEFLQPVYPDLRNRVDSGTLRVEAFLRGLDLYHFDYEKLEPSAIHVLDPSPQFAGLLDHLADHDSVDKKPALIRMGKIEHYLELSFALQVAFPGAQSIWHIVDRRVGQMRLI